MIEDGLIIPDKSPKDIIDKSFNKVDLIQLTSGIKRGYILADQIMHDSNSASKWLSFGRGDKYLFSRIKQIGVEAELCRLIEAGILNYDYYFKYNDRGNYPYLIIKKAGLFHMTVNQCHSLRRPARKSQYRKKENTNFQTSLVLSNEELVYNNTPVRDEYLELNHGYQSKLPAFIGLGIPMIDENKWAFKINLQSSLGTLPQLKFHTKASGPDPLTPDEFASYQERTSND